MIEKKVPSHAFLRFSICISDIYMSDRNNDVRTVSIHHKRAFLANQAIPI
jgi:hypothetical protein